MSVYTDSNIKDKVGWGIYMHICLKNKMRTYTIYKIRNKWYSFQLVLYQCCAEKPFQTHRKLSLQM